MSVTVDVNIVITYSLAVLVAFHSFKYRGAFKSLMLFLAALVVGGGIENINSILGGYYYPGSDFTLWLFHCPFDVVLGWYVIIYNGNFISHALIGKGRGSLSTIGFGTELENGIDRKFMIDTFKRAALSGYIAILLDFIVDPVAVENGWWIWQIDNIYVQGVPVGNYIGWFLLIFWTSVLYDIIITRSSVKRQKEIKTAGLWAAGTVVSGLLTGIILEACVLLFEMDGIRTGDRKPLAEQLASADMGALGIAAIIVLISLGLIILSSFAPNKRPEPRPTGKIWKIIPSILMLVFWVMVMIVAVISPNASLLVALGILSCIPYLWINLYVIKNWEMVPD